MDLCATPHLGLTQKQLHRLGEIVWFTWVEHRAASDEALGALRALVRGRWDSSDGRGER